MEREQSVEAYGSGVHYDTSPEVFELVLDRNMNYSCAYYLRGDEDLDSGQEAKMQGIARRLALKAGDRILDLGCGWCGPALYFIEHFGCHVTGVTLSPVQRDYALAWAKRRGITTGLDVEVRDVMDLPYPPTSFNHILFLESIIHMSQKDALFARCYDLLKPGGRLFIQESHNNQGSRGSRYVSDPGFMEVNRAFGFTLHLVSGGEMLCHLEEAGLIPAYLEDISTHYQRTLSQWLDRIATHAERIRSTSEHTYGMLRRYLLIALTTYRLAQTVCYQIVAQRPAR